MFNLFKQFLLNEDGWIQYAMAAASMASTHGQQKKQMAAAAADAKLQRAKLARARTRQAGDFATNTQRAREAAQRREINIEENAIRAESGLAETFAGSGISGTSMDELDSEIDVAAAKNKFENRKALDQQLGDAYRQNSQQVEDINADAHNIGAGGSSDGFAQLEAGASGFSTGLGINDALKGTSIGKSLGLG